MNYYNPDIDPGESEQEYEARKNEESKSATGLMFGIAGVFIFVLKMAAIFGIFFYAGFLLSQKLWGEETNKFKIWGFSIFFTYLIFCIIYFFKGTIIGLLANNRKLWILPWVLCVLLCCIVPSFIVKSLVAGMFNPTERQGILCIGFSWGAFILFSLYIYSIYQFKTRIAPKVLYWSYAWGLKLSS
ncbi:hypothetical protein [Flavobacterium humidisoli]|uniref:Uncharacterized protein n=1 Tax=Flavobacterium humidisoli TaxID=2937442 RepID=A0ABY4LTN1_9FLAO|nr:hypothetical protein [Flavobacterium humidisoli]UPZ16217.1 hypothetical protein M0M44_02450 [Flavobacterium humidisoli]